jgi:DNA (cytosine-5)-methyltransferase 1
MTFIDFFAGIGGFRAGLEQAGMTCSGWCEKDRFAQKSYRAIHENTETEWFRDDITKIGSGEIPDADGWTAGFPCTDISFSNKNRAGLAGERSGLFFEIVRLLKGRNPEDRPKWVILENVKAVLSVSRGFDFTEILYQMGEVGYSCEWDCVNSSAYVPQSRERIYIVGHIRSEHCGKVFPLGGKNGNAVKQIIGGSQSERVYDPNGLSVTIKSASGGKGGKTGLYFIAPSFIDLNADAKITDTARCLRARYKSGITRHKGENSGVLTEQFRIRRLTPLETFRLQGYSDEQFYRAQAVNSDNQLYRQSGNSVTVPAVREIGLKLMQVYGGG